MKEPAFERGFRRLLESVVRADQDQDRLIALAALGRLAAVVKKLKDSNLRTARRFHWRSIAAASDDERSRRSLLRGQSVAVWDG